MPLIAGFGMLIHTKSRRTLSYTEDEIKATYSSEFSSEMYVVEGNYTFKRV